MSPEKTLKIKICTKGAHDGMVRRLKMAANDKLDPKTMKNLRKSLADIEKGRVYPLSQVEKELGLHYTRD